MFFAHRACRRAVIGVLAFALALGACGDDDETSTAATSTAAPTTVAVTIPAGTPEAAAADAYKAVFDSNLGFDAKSKYLEDAANLRTTIDAYTNAGKSFGGIKLTPTAVAITGTSGALTYDVYFGTTQQYKALKGAIENRSGNWTVTKAEFCSFMSSARVPCA